MSSYGKEVIGKLMAELRDKVEIVTIEVSGCNREVMRLGAQKIFKGDNFEKLNRELAEYAEILVIIEGGENSGTVLAAECFLDLGKEIFCVPGRITDEGSYSTNWLVKQGANVLTEVGDIISECHIGKKYWKQKICRDNLKKV